jgi:mono/diheme cytochrome c family protein
MAIQSSWRGKRLVLSLSSIVLVVTLFAALTSCGESGKKTAEVSGQVDKKTTIKNLYNTKCGVCHGADGKLNYAGATNLTISGLVREEVIRQIQYGKGTMPPMKDVLTPAEIADLADYSMTLRVR